MQNLAKQCIISTSAMGIASLKQVSLLDKPVHNRAQMECKMG